MTDDHITEQELYDRLFTQMIDDLGRADALITRSAATLEGVRAWLMSADRAKPEED